MSIFNSILEKLGLHKPAAPAAPVAAAATVAPVPHAPAPAKTAVESMPHGPTVGYVPPATVPAAAPKPAPMEMVDVVSKLDAMAKKNPLLEWKVSIVDLLKLLGLDATGSAINELAIELGCPQELMTDSAKRNIWLHKTVLQKIADNGGNIPASLLHK